jgi:LmbE family N-acetylglucosaminyl deacetylase
VDRLETASESPVTVWLPRLPANPTILLLGAHADDIEIGCGGTVLELVRGLPGVQLVWVVFSGSDVRQAEAAASAHDFARGAASLDLHLHRFRDGFFPYEGGPVKEAFEDLKAEVAPDVVFTHHRTDRHQDHRVISDLTWNTFRDASILEYEIPKYDGDLGQPNYFVAISRETLDDKTALLERHFQSQRDKRWFTTETFRSLARIRGVECAAPTGYAEGFSARKILAQFGTPDRRS